MGVQYFSAEDLKLVTAGEKIEFIKVLRTKANMDLYPAKQMADAIFLALQLTDRIPAQDMVTKRELGDVLEKLGRERIRTAEEKSKRSQLETWLTAALESLRNFSEREI